MDCPICLDAIDVTQVNNKVTTECGHTFHCNCLMQSCAHNGFGCPYCRTVMATTPEDEDDEADEWVDHAEQDEDQENDRFSDNVLRGFRLFFNNVYNEEHDPEDLLDQQIDEENHEEEIEKPSAAHVTQALAAEGITMEHLVKVLLLDHDEYESEEEEYDQLSERVWGEMRMIISNYRAPEVQNQVEPVIQLEGPTTTAQSEETTTQAAEPKTRAVQRREFMIHV